MIFYICYLIYSLTLLLSPIGYDTGMFIKYLYIFILYLNLIDMLGSK